MRVGIALVVMLLARAEVADKLRVGVALVMIELVSNDIADRVKVEVALPHIMRIGASGMSAKLEFGNTVCRAGPAA